MDKRKLSASDAPSFTQGVSRQPAALAAGSGIGDRFVFAPSGAISKVGATSSWRRKGISDALCRQNDGRVMVDLKYTNKKLNL